MEEVSRRIGEKIRNYRKMKKMTLQELADEIHKSRPTVSKYETGEITLDVATLCRIAQVLEVGVAQLIEEPQRETPIPKKVPYSGTGPFFHAEQLYFYYYDGRYDRLKEAVIWIHKDRPAEDGSCETGMTIRSTTPSGRVGKTNYIGSVLYSDMLIRFSFINRANALEQDLLYIFNPLEQRYFTEGLLCGISTTDLMPCAFKCIVSLEPCTDRKVLRQQLRISPRELKHWKKLNMLIVDNNG